MTPVNQNLIVEILHHVPADDQTCDDCGTCFVTGSASSVCEPQCSERAAGGCLVWRDNMRFLQRST